VAVKAVFFDVGETLVDETRDWERRADRAGVPRFTFLGVLGALAGRGEHHRRVFEILGVEPVAFDGYGVEDLYPDAVSCLRELRRRGYLLGVAGNAPRVESMLRELVDVVGSSDRWGVEKPATAFFARVVQSAGCDPGEIAYVGDRVDNDVEPAVAAGMVAVHIRRGPWGYLQPGRERAHVRIDSLAELPDALNGV
jgi:HAD superfamily hydrolase (TIGR01509 family)